MHCQSAGSLPQKAPSVSCKSHPTGPEFSAENSVSSQQVGSGGRERVLESFMGQAWRDTSPFPSPLSRAVPPTREEVKSPHQGGEGNRLPAAFLNP